MPRGERDLRKAAAAAGDPLAIAINDGRTSISRGVLASMRAFRKHDADQLDAAVAHLEAAIGSFREGARVLRGGPPLVDPEAMRAPYKPRPKPGTAPDVVEDGRAGVVFWKGECDDRGPALLDRGDGDEHLFQGRWVSCEEARAYADKHGHEFVDT